MQELLTQIEADWRNCTRCPLGCKTGVEHVIYELLPPVWPNMERHRIMLIGEGPGEAENALGRPFVGPAGRLLRQVIKEANPDDIDIMLTNLVACRPHDKNKNREPRNEEIVACRPRLQSLIDIFQPEVVACLGRIPYEDITNWTPFPRMAVCNYFHPAYILRKGSKEKPAHTTIEYQNYVRSFYSLFNDVRNGHYKYDEWRAA